ncbi:MAG: D-tyrosyl-tRNA(Tyr) deacylase [Dehalococcoidia bacterium]|nr:D-tyrosyl-tRNA(Tyr) deacylase [Dehalococcoidia bacterium]MEC7920615.1 D-aminoacyl-tRNA deacylase [Chloroflexota bacterium]MQG04827.1 D-tyrosyl-tRNA(Tyr) deacylase [SAR202 cluster bacterium]|tara:strand:- start:4653 stop:5120 length:468 start_codon:yes stop_codon:yes gene_type:complete
MIALVQRVEAASVSINSKIYSKITEGILVFLGIVNSDTEDDSEYIIKKLLNLRLFPSTSSNFDLSVQSGKKSILVISNFTLSSITRIGNRPDFSNALDPKSAEIIYQKFVAKLKNEHSITETGIFGEEMNIESNNWGPLTLIIDSNDRKIPRSNF